MLRALANATLWSGAGAAGMYYYMMNYEGGQPVKPPQPGDKAPQEASEEERALVAASGTLNRVKFATLATIGEDGYPCARVVWPNSESLAYTGQADIATTAASRKASQLDRSKGKACLLWFDPPRWAYVAAVGQAERIRDAEERKRAFREQWRPFFPLGPTSDNFALYRFSAHRMEVVSPQHRLMSPAKLAMGRDKAWRSISADKGQGKS